MSIKLRWAAMVLAGLLTGLCGATGSINTASTNLTEAAVPRALPSVAASTITHGDFFTWAAAAYPSYFPG
ncbi:MAG: hypothetical protein WCH60_03945, partial [Burkholderiales bacterium]